MMDTAAIIKTMREAYRDEGCDPYNSSVAYELHWARDFWQRFRDYLNSGK
jgi:hypothetical protein